MTDREPHIPTADDHDFYVLATRYLDGQADEQTVAALADALRTSRRHRDLFVFLSYETRLLHYTQRAGAAQPEPHPLDQLIPSDLGDERIDLGAQNRGLLSPGRAGTDGCGHDAGGASRRREAPPDDDRIA